MHDDDWLGSDPHTRQEILTVFRTGTTDSLGDERNRVVLVTTTGAKSPKNRCVLVIRVEHESTYAMAASKGGHPQHPAWYYNLKAHPEV